MSSLRVFASSREIDLTRSREGAKWKTVSLCYPRKRMTNIEVIEREVEKLTPEELAEFRAWFIEHDWETWDRELERDVAAGRLERFATEALAEIERGETKEL
jgi:hypothetical protein